MIFFELTWNLEFGFFIFELNGTHLYTTRPHPSEWSCLNVSFGHPQSIVVGSDGKVVQGDRVHVIGSGILNGFEVTWTPLFPFVPTATRNRGRNHSVLDPSTFLGQCLDKFLFPSALGTIFPNLNHTKGVDALRAPANLWDFAGMICLNLFGFSSNASCA